jgi:hypothetical protein
MKYRRLSLEELQSMEKEFIEYLASNSITGDDWQSLKRDQPEKAEERIEHFSDIVFEKVLSNIQLLEHRTKSEISYLKFNAEQVDMIGVKLEGESNIDFTQNEAADEMIAKAQAANVKLSVFSTERIYKKEERNLEVFKHLQMNMMICEDARLYEALCTYKKSK